MKFGEHLPPTIRSVGADGGGDPVDINFMWLPFGVLSFGVWAGFLSGYKKMRIFPKDWSKQG